MCAGLLAWQAIGDAPTNDEIAYLPAGLSHWQFGRFELCCVNPPLPRMIAALPVLAMRPATDWRGYPFGPQFRSWHNVGCDFLAVNRGRWQRMFVAARLTWIPFFLVGAWVVWRWAGELWGPVAEFLAIVAWGLSPEVLAHGHLITPDLPATATGVGAMYAFREWLKRGSWKATMVAGGALGLAQLTKMTWLPLLGLYPLLAVVAKIVGFSTFGWRRLVLHVSVMIFVAVVVVNAGYGYSETGRPLGSLEFVSQAFTGTENTGQPGNRFRDGPLNLLPIPIPAMYLHGIDVQRTDFEQGLPSYLRGRWQSRGWWYYYLYGLAVKLPLGTWGLWIVALGMSLGAVGTSGRASFEDVLLLAPATMVIGFASAHTGFSHHLRYVLPALPFLFIWASRVGRLWPAGRLSTRLLVGGLAGWAALSSLVTVPHSLSYFNELAGGPRGGIDHLNHSNIDWGQDLLYLRRWSDRHSEAAPLRVAYYGLFDPALAELDIELPPFGRPAGPDGATSRELGPQPGWYAVSANLLVGHGCRIYAGGGRKVSTGFPDFAYFRQFTPVASAGYSIWIYHLSRSDANQARKRLGYAPL